MIDLHRTSAVLGTMTFGDTVDADVATTMIDAALDEGVDHLDTANVYAGGASEEILGQAIRDRRDEVTIATKVGMPHPDAGDRAPLSAGAIRDCVAGSLRRLNTDRVELLYLHQPDRRTPLAETLTAVGELMEAGKVGALGVSNYAAWQIAELNHMADALGIARPVVAQQLYNLLARRIEEEYAEFARVTDLVTMVYNPLGGGLLTGQHRFDADPGEGRFGTSKLAEMYKQRYWNRAVFEAIEALTTIADKAEMTLVELAFRWLRSTPTAGPILLGGSKVEHLRANLEILAKGPLPDEVMSACADVGADLRGPMPNYNR